MTLGYVSVHCAVITLKKLMDEECEREERGETRVTGLMDEILIC